MTRVSGLFYFFLQSEANGAMVIGVRTVVRAELNFGHLLTLSTACQSIQLQYTGSYTCDGMDFKVSSAEASRKPEITTGPLRLLDSE